MQRGLFLYTTLIAGISILALFMSIRSNKRVDESIYNVSRYFKEAAKSDSVYRVLQDSLTSLQTRIADHDKVVARHSDTLKLISKKYDKVRKDYIALPVDSRVRVFADWLSEVDSNTGK